MIRIIVGLLLLGVGAYFAWEADSALGNGLFQLSVMCDAHEQISEIALTALNSPAVDLAHAMGADTFGEMDNYLSIMRIVGIVVAIFGVILVVTRARRFV